MNYKISEGNKMEKIELKASEIKQIELRQSLINMKQQEMQKLALEKQIIDSNLKHYFTSLLDTYKLDKEKKYSFDGQSLIQEEEKDVQHGKKVQKSKN